MRCPTCQWGDSYSDPADAAREDGYFYALDAVTGELLWKRELVGSVQSPPITYSMKTTMPPPKMAHSRLRIRVIGSSASALVPSYASSRR